MLFSLFLLSFSVAASAYVPPAALSPHLLGAAGCDRVWGGSSVKLGCGARPQVGIRGEVRFRRCGSEVGVAMLAPSSPTDDSAESMLLEAKRQIAHIGDVGNIAMYVKMLKIAKNALTGALEESAGKPSGMATSLIRELASVNPLSQPARDELMSRKYEFLSHPSSENARFQLGSKIQFALETPEETPLVDDEASAR
eukprot:CAMPEP_0179464714 /NCGR_PEP_ID=MMETSP0799-20121207/46463_1 /TAXON_ID=46947 /ORGANISM="Geminigera cryophila, Strain CCMP2564" /LENGTH=196 /DNA_ID=CAMNT_0021268639 /DNA_START=17 /DNA_END=604 /DNA_ORIENTATION=+